MDPCDVPCLHHGFVSPTGCPARRAAAVAGGRQRKGKNEGKLIFLSPNGRNLSSQVTRDKVKLLGLVTHEMKAPVVMKESSFYLSQ